jgi:predicted ester cyclase
MSPLENKAIARRFFDEIWNKGNFGVIDEHIAVNFVEHFPGMESGREGFRRTAALFRKAFPDLELIIHDEIAEADRVVHRWTWKATHKGELYGMAPTGKHVEFSGMVIVRLEGVEIVERWTSLDMLGLLQQLGALPPLPPPPPPRS